MSKETALDVEANLQSENESIEFVRTRLERLGVKHSVDTFLTSIGGSWRMSTYDYRTTWVIDQFSGDIVWFDRSWIASGIARSKNRNTGYESQVAWSIDYDQGKDAITWICGSLVSTYGGVSNPDGPIQHRVSVPEKKLLVVVRSDVPIAHLQLRTGSNLAVA
ncbi:MAG: hypothetical protein PSV26_21650 [Polaromonas sp.]|uniref:hypothetical protein n=1 Tax=Polaromonas sp. TaxID=1869339 RepID=UPI002489DE63|nr:hypothetical protein [Polaromonas sp.]MDI1240095.1 hypothetical protein [Polaromonas sp.]